MVEMANVFAVGIAAKSAKLSAAHPEVAARQNFDKATRAKLEGLAPAALPFVSRWIGDHAIVAACIFGGQCAWAIAGNMSAVRRLAPPKEQEPERKSALAVTPPADTPPMQGMEGPPPSFR